MDQKMEPRVNPDDEKLQELINWMLDSYTVREMLKRLIANREKREEAWLVKNLNEGGTL